MKQNHYIYRYQKPCDYFVLLIEGSFIVESGQEKIESFDPCILKDISL